MTPEEISSNAITLTYIGRDLEVSEMEHPAWSRSDRIDITQYWNGNIAPESRQFAAQILWSKRYLYVRFETPRSNEMLVNENAQTDEKTIGLWERDVCEIFVAPDKKEPRRYLEFEVAPTGEWLDLAIDMTTGERKTDWGYQSGMEAAARIEKDRVVMTMRIPWMAFGITPKAGDVWLGNIFRCTGKDPGRGYLAWKPTMTAAPNFHVPERFGQLIFDN